MLPLVKQIIKKPNIAIDLGTANTRIYACERGTITEEPSLVRSIRKNKNEKKPDPYVEYLNSKLVSFPLRGGVIVDVNAAVSLLKPLFNRVRKGFRQPVSLACAPTDSSEKERKLLREAILHAGASKVAIIPEPWAAAIGAGVDPTLPHAQMLIDVGEGVTDMAVFREGRFVFTSAVRTACFDIHKALRRTVILRHRVFLYRVEVEKLTHEIDSSLNEKPVKDKIITVKGIDIAKGFEVSTQVTRREVITAVKPVICGILNMIESGLQKLPEDISREVSESGIWLTGGGSCIKGMAGLVESRTNLNVRVAPDPVYAVINGAIQTLQYWKDKASWWENIPWPISRSN